MGGDVSEDGGMSHRVARCSKNFIIFVALSLIMPAHLLLLLSLLAYLCHPTSRALTSNLAPARAKTTKNQQKDRKSSVVWSCDSSWMSVGLSKYSHSPADVRQEDTRARRQERTSGSGKSHWPRKTYARAFRSMNLNARRRLGLRRQRDDADQRVLVEHHRRCRS